MAQAPEKSAESGKSAADLDADVLIVGGGMVGGTLALALARGGLGVALIDQAEPRALLAAGFDGRASAIALGSRRVLEGLDLWPLLRDEAAAIDDIRVSDGNSLFFLHYDHRDTGDEPFGHMVENRNLRKALATRLPSTPGLTLLAPAVVAERRRDDSGVAVVLDDGRRITAKLMIGAEGRQSPTREEAGIRLTRWSYRQTGIVCTVAHEKPHMGVAQEHFLPAGPFAILPLTGNRSSIVWTERSSLAPAIMALDEAGFLAELKSRFGDFLGELKVIGPRWAYPLSLQFAARTIGRRLALVGDAAHGMHPIAGQGLNMGLRDIAALAQVLVDAHRLGLDIGAATVLEDYERWRRFDNTLMLAATDGLNRLFSNSIRPLRLARDLGLAAVNRLGPVKRFLMRQAMGLSGDLPRLMRGQEL